MSACVTLIPLAVALCVSAVETVGMVRQKCANKEGLSQGIQTRFNDEALLVQTLQEHGLQVQVSADGSIRALCPEGSLVYRRGGQDNAYMIHLDEVRNVEGLLCDIDLIEKEYGMNVQSYTYHRVMDNLDDHMRVEEEKVLADDSILITISLDN